MLKRLHYKITKTIFLKLNNFVSIHCFTGNYFAVCGNVQMENFIFYQIMKILSQIKHFLKIKINNELLNIIYPLFSLITNIIHKLILIMRKPTNGSSNHQFLLINLIP